MKIEIEAFRRLNRLIRSLSDDLVNELLGPIGLKRSIDPDKRVEFLDNQRGGDWSLSDYKILWGVAEIAYFYSTWVTPYKVEPQSLTLREARNRIKHEELKNDNLIALEMSYDPKIFFLARTPDTYRALVDKTLTSEDIRDSVYWVPELGIILTNIHDDENGNLFREIVTSQLTGEFTEFRIKSLIVTRLFDTDRNINELVVSADPQISGFSGLDEITFVGPDVKKGLAGMYRRHDIRVHIHQIGPNIAVENEHIRLRIGSELKIKSIEGIIELHMLMYPEFYPSDDQIAEIIEQFEKVSEVDDQIMQLKRENYEDLTAVEDEIKELQEKADNLSEIKLTDLANRWELDQFRVEYTLNKVIENGEVKGKFVEDAIIKR